MDSSASHLGTRAINVGLRWNIILAALKVGFGIFGHSTALLADGINSTSDVAYYVVVKIFMALAGRPPDREHPYGHRQLESVAALAVGAFVVTTAITIFWDAINSVYDILAGGTDGKIAIYALWVALFTVAIKIVLTVYTGRVARSSGNATILALAKDHRNDVFTASAAAIGIVLNKLGYAWGDPLLAAGVAVVVLLTGIQILRQSSSDLMDAVPSREIESQARDVLRNVTGVLTVEDVQAHRYGPYITLNLTIGVDGSTTVAKGDRIASEAEMALISKIELVQQVYVHYHPAGASKGQNP